MQALIEYNVTDTMLSELKDRYGNMLLDIDDELGLKEKLKPGLRELQQIRTGVEKKRKELNADAHEWIRRVNAEGSRITDFIKSLEEPMKANRKEIEAELDRRKREKEEAERKRVETIKFAIAEIDKMAESLGMSDSAEIKSRIEHLNRIEVSEESFAEFVIEAEEARDGALVDCRALLVKREAFEGEQKRLKEEAERQRKEREEMEAQRREIEEAKRKLREEQEKIEAVKREAERKERERLEAIEREKAEEKALQEAVALAEKQKREAEERAAQKAKQEQEERERREAEEAKRIATIKEAAPSVPLIVRWLDEMTVTADNAPEVHELYQKKVDDLSSQIVKSIESFRNAHF